MTSPRPITSSFPAIQTQSPLFPYSPVYKAADLQEARRNRIIATNSDLPAWVRYLAKAGKFMLGGFLSSAGCGGASNSSDNECVSLTAVSPAGLIADHPALNERGDIAFDGAMTEMGGRQVYIVNDGTISTELPSQLNFDGNNSHPFIDNAGNILYQSGPDNGATIRFFNGNDHDRQMTSQQNCFFPEMTPDGASAIYLCGARNLILKRPRTTYYVQDLITGGEQPLNPSGIAVDRAAISRDGNLIALSTRWPHDRDDTNGLADDIYLLDRKHKTTGRVSLDQASRQRNTPSKNPRLFDNGKGLKLLSYVTLSPTNNQVVVIYDLVQKKILKEIETNRQASIAGDVDIEPYLAGDQGELLLIQYADGLYLQKWSTPGSPKKLIDHEATQGTMNIHGRIAFVKKDHGKDRVYVTDACNYF